jgi:16S rRNA (guanine(966)-N(2))-methyltransferase RsmD
MRIIGGKHKGKNIIAPKNLPVRPTTDFAKESLFNILNNRIDFEEVELLELFAGTGNIGYEFASRGCQTITSVDVNFQCVQFIKKMSKELGYPTRVIRSEVFRFLKQNKTSFNFIFADPPYQLEGIDQLPELIFEQGILKPEGILVVEHDRSTNFAEHPRFEEERQYGKVHFSFFS